MAETVNLVVAGIPFHAHKHCMFCGEAVTNMSAADTICNSPANDLAPDTVGKRHHAFLVAGKNACVSIKDDFYVAQPSPTPAAGGTKDSKWLNSRGWQEIKR